jgi:hypothetical protein
MHGIRCVAALFVLALAMSCTSIPMSAHRFPVSKNKTLAASDLIEVGEVDRSIQVELIFRSRCARSSSSSLLLLASFSGPMFDSTPVIHDRRIYAPSKDGYLYCLRG